MTRPSIPTLLKDSLKVSWKTNEDKLEAIGLSAFLVPSIIDPVIFAAKVKMDKDIAEDKKTTMIRQNSTHHLFNLLIEVLAMMGAKPLVGYIAYKNPRVAFLQKIWGFVGLMLAKSIIRPFVMIKFSKSEKKEADAKKAEMVAPMPARNPVITPLSRPATPIVRPAMFGQFSI